MKEFANIFKNLKTHLLNGVSYMIPVVVGSGILMALSVMFWPLTGGEGVSPTGGFLKVMFDIGATGLGLMVPVMSAYIAASIADRPGIAPGLIGGAISTAVGAGFLGGIVTGIVAGVLCYYLKKIPLPKNLQSLKSIFIIPIIGTFVVGVLMYSVIGTPLANLMALLNNFLSGLTEGGKIVLGMVIGLMIAFDMGGPCNKVAYGLMVAALGDQLAWGPLFAGACTAAIAIPPIGMGLASLIFRKKFTKQERDTGISAIILGSVGITEGAIPYATADPLRVIPSIMIGSAVGGMLCTGLGVTNAAAWGGFITAPTSSPWWLYCLCILAGSLVTAVLVSLLKKPVKEEAEETVAAAAAAQEIDIEFE